MLGIDEPMTLTLGDGNSLNTSTHSTCGNWAGDIERIMHHHRVQINVSCETVTRYLSFRIHFQDGIDFPLELCELVVIGSNYISKFPQTY